jgi:4'-phosphopantetheinyl transferase EntD
VIERLLPATVRWAESFELRSDHELFPEELALIERAVAKRRDEFASARACARTALAELGRPPAPILRGPRGEPLWPRGVVGSITHCAGYCAAAVAPAGPTVAIGIDAEPDRPLPEGVLETVGLPAERDRASAARAERPGPHWDRLLFSAKESTYKAWYPLTGRWLGFEEAEIRIDPAGTFSAHLLVPGPVVAGREVRQFPGRWLAARGLVVTSIAVEARP